MKSRQSHSPLLWPLLLVTLLVMPSCSDDGCIDNASCLPLVAFYVGEEPVSIDSLTVKGVGAPGDSLLVADEKVHQLYLPLRVSENCCRFVFTYKPDVVPSDTVSIYYDAVPTFVSRECGAMCFFRIKNCTTTHNAIDTISVLDSTISNQDKVYVKIYMRQ